MSYICRHGLVHDDKCVIAGMFDEVLSDIGNQPGYVPLTKAKRAELLAGADSARRGVLSIENEPLWNHMDMDRGMGRRPRADILESLAYDDTDGP